MQNIQRLVDLLPTIAVDGRRFNAATVAFWPVPTEEDWVVFVAINAALREVRLCTEDFSITAATGTDQQTVRFPVFGDRSEYLTYYNLSPVTAMSQKAAIILRSGVDEFIEAARLRSRFVGDSTTALKRGNDTPSKPSY